jgi:hypothetical protein
MVEKFVSATPKRMSGVMLSGLSFHDPRQVKVAKLGFYREILQASLITNLTILTHDISRNISKMKRKSWNS